MGVEGPGRYVAGEGSIRPQARRGCGIRILLRIT
jgi:hypothetical protein